MAEQAYEWLRSHLGDERYAVLLDVRKRVARVLAANVFKHYTNHDVEHSDRIVNILSLLLETRSGSGVPFSLNKDELFVLVLSALYHDIGLQLPLEHGINKPINEISADDLEEMRKRHGEVCYRVLYQTTKSEKDKHELGLMRPEIRVFVPYVAEACRRHQSAAEYDPREVVEVGADVGGSRVRIGILTGLLRLTDQLDCDQRRVDIKNLEAFMIPEESRLHWYVCHYVDAVLIENGRITVHASWPETASSSIVDYLAGVIIDKIDAELRACEDALWDNGIRLKLAREVVKKKTDYSFAKKPLPEDLQRYVERKVTLSRPTHVIVDSDEIGLIERTEEYVDWMTHWGMIGDPFIDYPLAYGSSSLIVTEQHKKIAAEIASYLKGPSGELRLVVAPRGQGKTTLFQYLNGHFAGAGRVTVIDVGDKVGNIRSLAAFSELLFKGIFEEFAAEDDIYTPDGLIDRATRMGKRIVCVDSIDRLSEENDDMVKDFFMTAQHLLTSLKKNVILILSCSDRWGRFFEGEELSYLGAGNQWRLLPFSTNDSRELLDRRLQSSGLAFNRVFEEGCVAPLHTMSKGNPRRLLQHAQAICKFGAEQKVRKIDAKFINENYHKDFEGAFKALLDGLSEETDQDRSALKHLYAFFLEIERRSLNCGTGCGYLVEILGSRLNQESVSPAYYAPLAYVANLSDSIDIDKRNKRVYMPRPDIKHFFSSLKSKGYSPREFLTFYSTSPYLPSRDRDDIVSTVRSTLLTGDDVQYFERARILYDEVQGAERGTPPILIVRAWDVVQNLLAAILVKRNLLRVVDYESQKDAVFSEDRYGNKRYVRGAGRILETQAKWIVDFFYKEVLKDKKWMNSWNSLYWILRSRNNIVKGKSDFISSIGDKELTLCRGHLRLVFSELLSYYK